MQYRARAGIFLAEKQDPFHWRWRRELFWGSTHPQQWQAPLLLWLFFSSVPASFTLSLRFIHTLGESPGLAIIQRRALCDKLVDSLKLQPSLLHVILTSLSKILIFWCSTPFWLSSILLAGNGWLPNCQAGGGEEGCSESLAGLRSVITISLC